jgi:Mu transposase-like protein
VVRACFYDPDSHDVYLAFAAHWGFTPLPTQPRRPEENGKQERSGGYVKDNALKGRRFDSLNAQNAFLRHWNRTIARLRIHGTTRRQVWTHFVEVEQRALQPLAGEAFPCFASGERTVHTDGHVEVAGAFYPVPLALLGRRLRVRWDAHLVRVFDGDTLVMVHARVAAGIFAPRAGEAEASTRQHAYVDRLVGQCARAGPALKQWADAALAARGVRAIRLIQGVLALTRRYPRERVLAAVNAQTYPFAGKLRPDRVAIRRDGFSQDSVEALANLRRAARDRGELRMIVWRGPGGRPVHDRRLGAATSVCRCSNRPARAADSIGSETSRPTHGAVVPIRRAIATVVPPVPQPTSSS